MPINRRSIDKDKPIEIRIKHPKTKETIKIYKFEDHMDVNDLHMVKAKVEYKNGDIFNICFRNPQNISVNLMRKDYLFGGLAIHGDLDDLQLGKYNYLGTILYNKQKKKNPYSIIEPTKEENEYVRKYMDTKLDIWEEKQQLENREDIESEKEENKKEKFTQSIKVDLDKYFEEKKKNMENPFLRTSKLINENGIEEKIYEGVDLTTGDFLVLKNAQYKEIDERVIYTGYLSYMDTLEEKNTRTKQEMESYQVIFEMPYKLDEAIEKGNINAILQLLSKNEMLLKRYRLNLLGKIQENDIVRRYPYKASENIFSHYKQKAVESYKKNSKQDSKEIE